MILGWCGCVGSLVLASFATSVTGLMWTQGVLYGISWPICFTPFLLMINEWFSERRGSVYGIIYGASGLGGIVLPFMLEKLLDAWDFRITLRVVAAMMIVMSGPTLIFVKPPPKDHKEKEEVKTSLGGFAFVKDRLFWIFAAAALVQGLSFYLPRFYLPSYAHALGLSHSQGATILAAYNLAQVSGQMGLGFLSDKVNIFIPIILSTAVPALSALVLWGPAKSFAPLILFALLCGSFGAAFSVLWARMSTALSDDPPTATLIFGVFICERGIANGLAGPISELLTGETLDLDTYGLSKYTGVILFVGITSFLAALSGLGYFLPRRDREEKDDASEAAFAPLHELSSLESLLSQEGDQGHKM
jgi:MFS family permease